MAITFCCLNHRGISHIRDELPRADVPVAATISAAVGVGGANRNDDVLTVQQLLNAANARIGCPAKPLDEDGWIGPKTVAAIREFQQKQLGFNDGRVDPNQKTITRLNEIRATGMGGAPPSPPTPTVPVVTAPPPATPATPLQMATAAAPTARLWAVLAKSHIDGLRAGLTASGGQVLLPLLFDAVNTHFHLDRDPTRLTINLQTLSFRFGLIVQVLSDPAKFFKQGPAVADSPFADAPVGGFQFPGTKFHFITFRPGFVTCGPNTRAAMLVHEGAHFIGGVNEIGHFAMEFPAPDGQPQGTGNTRNYKQLLTDEALKNASSYAAFAIHAATGVDSRFGGADITK